jgi:hypothetical protein
MFMVRNGRDTDNRDNHSPLDTNIDRIFICQGHTGDLWKSFHPEIAEQAASVNLKYCYPHLPQLS